MISLRLFLPLPVIAAFFIISGAPFTSCTKTRTIYVRDTTVRNDTVYDYTTGMVAYYNFNGGNLNDSSGYQNNITFNNATLTADRYGRANNAYLFNGSSSYMSVPNSASLNPGSITLYAIVKINGFYSGIYDANIILDKGYNYANGNYGLAFLPHPDTGVPDTATEYIDENYGDQGAGEGTTDWTAIQYQPASHVSAGTWYRFAFTYDGLTAKLYINGALVGTKSATGIPFTPQNTNLVIGGQIEPTGLYPYWFNGVIDEIRIYNRALPPQAIAQLSDLTE